MGILLIITGPLLVIITGLLLVIIAGLLRVNLLRCLDVQYQDLILLSAENSTQHGTELFPVPRPTWV